MAGATQEVSAPTAHWSCAECWSCIAPTPLPQVAQALLGGIERGDYHLPSPDLGQNLLVSAMTGLRCGNACWYGGVLWDGGVAQPAWVEQLPLFKRTGGVPFCTACPGPQTPCFPARPPATQPQALLAAAASAAGTYPAARHLAVWLDCRPGGTAAQHGARHATARIQLTGCGDSSSHACPCLYLLIDLSIEFTQLLQATGALAPVM